LLADPNDAWTSTGIVVEAHNAATFRLSSEPTAPDEHATFVSSPRLAIPVDAGDTLLAGAYDPPEQSCQFETTGVNIAWLDALGDREGLGAIMRLVIDVSGADGADVSGGFGSVYFSETGPANPSDILVAEVRSETGTFQHAGSTFGLTGGFYSTGW